VGGGKKGINCRDAPAGRLYLINQYKNEVIQMKNITRLAIMWLLAIMFMGCYKQTRLEQMGTPIQFEVVGLDDPAPSQDEADLIVTTHIKKASYLLSPRTAETLYTFTLSVDGQMFREDVKGVEEVISDTDKEKGKGIHYLLKKRLRLRLGSHEIALKTEERSSAKVKIGVEGGKGYTMSFEPVYGRKRGLFGGFGQGFLYYEIFLDGERVSQ